LWLVLRHRGQALKLIAGCNQFQPILIAHSNQEAVAASLIAGCNQIWSILIAHSNRSVFAGNSGRFFLQPPRLGVPLAHCNPRE
jgi:hypothetical protein